MSDIQEMKIELDLVAPFRRAMIDGFADLIMAQRDLRFAIILELLERDDVARMMIAESFGEIVQKAIDDEDEDTSWDEFIRQALDELRDTPGGRGEVQVTDAEDVHA